MQPWEQPRGGPGCVVTPGCAVQGWARGGSRTSPPQGRGGQGTPFLRSQGDFTSVQGSQPQHEGPGLRADHGSEGRFGHSLGTGPSLARWEEVSAQFRPALLGELGREGPRCQVSTQKLRVIRRQ